MHHEHELDYESAEELRRREDEAWGYGDPSRHERGPAPRQRRGREGMPGAGGPYGESYEREPRYDRGWEYEGPRAYERSRGYPRGDWSGRPWSGPGNSEWERAYGNEAEAPNEARRRPYGEGSYVQYDRLAPATRRGWGARVSQGYGTHSDRDRPPGQYAGRGPKGYTRSPERILEDVAERLTDAPDVDASDIEVGVDGDVVVLRGRVYDRGQKRAAEDVVETVSGVRDVRNELGVEKGMLQELTDAVTGRSDDEHRATHVSPRETGVS